MGGQGVCENGEQSWYRTGLRNSAAFSGHIFKFTLIAGPCAGFHFHCSRQLSVSCPELTANERCCQGSIAEI